VDRLVAIPLCGLSAFLFGKSAFLCGKFSLAHRSRPTISWLGRLLGDPQHARIMPDPALVCERGTELRRDALRRPFPVASVQFLIWPAVVGRDCKLLIEFPFLYLPPRRGLRANVVPMRTSMTCRRADRAGVPAPRLVILDHHGVAVAVRTSVVDHATDTSNIFHVNPFQYESPIASPTLTTSLGEDCVDCETRLKNRLHRRSGDFYASYGDAS
jgi:hypothetical protein